MKKAPVLAGAFFSSLISLPDWAELVCQLYVVCFYGFMGFGGLTRFLGWFVVEI
jgi:hypothetical protein